MDQDCVVVMNRMGLTILLLFLLGTPPNRAQADELLKRRLLQEAPKSWKALRQFVSGLEVSMTYQYRPPPTGKDMPRNWSGFYYRLLVNADNAWCEQRKVSVQRRPNGEEEWFLVLYGINSKYAFHAQSAEYNSTKYDLDSLEKSSSEFFQKNLDSDVSYFTYVAFAVQGYPLQKMSENQKEFTIQDVRSVRIGDKKCAVLEMDYKAFPEPKVKSQYPRHYSITLDPENSWCVLAYEIDAEMIHTSVQIEYGKKIEGFPIPRIVKHTEQYKNNGTGLSVIREYTKWIHRAAPESEFMLTAFGLPEPPDWMSAPPPVASKSTAWIWYLGAGLLLVAIVGGLTWYMRAKRAAEREV